MKTISIVPTDKESAKQPRLKGDDVEAHLCIDGVVDESWIYRDVAFEMNDIEILSQTLDQLAKHGVIERHVTLFEEEHMAS